MTKTPTHQIIALAGLSQAVWLVHQIATRGHAGHEDIETSISSTLKIDADDVLDVYGGLPRLTTGLRQLERQLSGPGRADAQQARHASTLILLERRLMRQPAMVEAIRVSVREAEEKAGEGGPLDDDVLQTLAGAYQATLSRLKPRVLVTGEQRYLSDPENARTIRALLLAGIRSVVLWRQCGGARWKLLLRRDSLHREARRLLASL